MMSRDEDNDSAGGLKNGEGEKKDGDIDFSMGDSSEGKTTGLKSEDVSNTDQCASCGKIADGLKACNACKLVKYCNSSCQKIHWPSHKKECKKRAAEIYDEALFKDPSGNEDCPICFVIMSHESDESIYKPCCGKVLCMGCTHGVNERAIEIMDFNADVCPFCRGQKPASDQEENEMLRKRMELDDGFAFNRMGAMYQHGLNGMPVDLRKAHGMYLKAGELGCNLGYYNVGGAYISGRGVERSEKKARKYWELAAMAGDAHARYNMGGSEGRAGNVERSIKHFLIGARAGHKTCLDAVKECYLDKDITKNEYEAALRAYQQSQDEMKSEKRDKAINIRDQGRAMGFNIY